MRRGRPGRQRRLGLKTRVILSFAVGAALVSGVLAAVTFGVVSRSTLDQREASALRQALNNAQLVKQELAAPSANVPHALATLTFAADNRALLYRRGLWYGSGASEARELVPSVLTRTVLAGHVATQRITDGGEPAVVVGIPLPSIGVAYFEEHSLAELQATLAVLATVLALTATATTLGGALAGWWASRRLIRPLVEMAGVAAEIGRGDLEQRLPHDPDLDPLVSSFNSMVATLKTRLERDARFASEASHELRSPLTTLAAAVELLKSRQCALPQDARAAVEALDVEVTRFSDLVEDLLEMARLDAGTGSLNLVDVPLAELVGHSLSPRQTEVVVLGEGASTLEVRADKRRLQRALENLVENADAHAGGLDVVHVGRTDGWATISVEDRGPGVALEERQRIFERFYRGAPSGNRGHVQGTGLGLALVAQHVHAHGGTVHVEDRPGGGARFVVRLPVHR